MAASLGSTTGVSVVTSLHSVADSTSSRVKSPTSTFSVLNQFEGLRLSTTNKTRYSTSDFSRVCNATICVPSSGKKTRPSITMGSTEAGIGILGNKVGMMAWFAEDGKVIPVTVIGLAEGNLVTQVKTPETDGYSAVQVGYEAVLARKLTKPELGHIQKAFAGLETKAPALRHLQEFRLLSVEGFEAGQQLKAEEIFKAGDLVDVTGNSIGKGFQGGIKAHNFARGLMTHGSKSHRQLGSIGAGTTPGRVYPGKKMPKRMGNAKTKIRKLEIVKVDTELNAIIVKGSVPGKRGNLIRITPAKIVGKNIPKN